MPTYKSEPEKEDIESDYPVTLKFSPKNLVIPIILLILGITMGITFDNTFGLVANILLSGASGYLLAGSIRSN